MSLRLGFLGSFWCFFWGGRLGSAIHNDLPVLYGFTEEVFAHVLGLWAKDVRFSCKALEGEAQEGVVYGSFRLSKRFCGDAGLIARWL